MPKIGAGDLRDRVQLLRRGTIDDGHGNQVPGGDFELINTVWAKLAPLRGGEGVQQARLAGKQPYIVTVRQTEVTRQIDETWELRDARNPDRKFAVTAAPTDPDGKRAWLDILVTLGAAS